jgi:branched-chain amino acid transport system ATP-binding protein
MSDPLLDIRDLCVSYGAIQALHGVTLRIPQGEIVTLVGANGAGKSTVLRTISGILQPTSGEILFRQTSIAGRPIHKIVGLGIAHAPEGRMIFSNLTVLENLRMGAYLRPCKNEMADGLEKAFSLFPRLAERRGQEAGTLSGGEQQMLAIARALMSRPDCLLLDEPSLGIAPILIQTIFERIVEINRTLGLTILLVEQNAHLALEISHFAYVMETGRVTLEGPPDVLREDPAVRDAYLGGG